MTTTSSRHAWRLPGPEASAPPTTVHGRVDRDQGLTAGIDFGLAMVAALRDDAYAMAVQRVAEYDRTPPFGAGSPARAPSDTTALITAMVSGFLDRARADCGAAVKRMPA